MDVYNDSRVGITGRRPKNAPRYHQSMTTEQPRTDASSRERSPEEQYSLSIEQAAELYAQAGHSRTIRAVQKYCALSKLDCHKVETETGEKYLVAPYSVTRHIAYRKEVRTVATSRDQTRKDASVRPLEIKAEPPPVPPANGNEQPRIDATSRDKEDRYVARLEGENEFLRSQISVKDTQIAEMTERTRETNMLVAGLQKLLAPLLTAPGERRTQDGGDGVGA